MMDEKKKRNPNFAGSEKSLLLHLVASKKNVIENKKTDSQTWREKDQAWDCITKLFNSQNPANVSRSKESLKKFYDNLKKIVRKSLADEKVEITKTGGGGCKMKSKDPNLELCLSIMNTKTVFGLDNPYGGDVMKPVTEAEISDDCIDIDDILCETNNEPDICLDPQPSTSGKCSQISEIIINDHNYSSCELVAQREMSNTSVQTQDSTIKRDWTKISASQLKHKVSDSLQHSWSKRRRPVLNQPNDELVTQYTALGKAKLECFLREKENINKRSEREDELFKLKRKKLELDIRIRELELQEKENQTQ